MALIGKKSGRFFRNGIAVLLVALYAVALVHFFVPFLHAHHEQDPCCAFCALFLTPGLACAMRTVFLFLRRIAQAVMLLRVLFRFPYCSFFFLRGPPLTA
jgi:hypothetical protein